MSLEWMECELRTSGRTAWACQKEENEALSRSRTPVNHVSQSKLRLEDIIGTYRNLSEEHIALHLAGLWVVRWFEDLWKTSIWKPNDILSCQVTLCKTYIWEFRGNVLGSAKITYLLGGRLMAVFRTWFVPDALGMWDTWSFWRWTNLVLKP